MPIAIFGITNDGVNLVVNLVVLTLVVTYVAMIAWTYLDAKRRLEDPVLIACAVAASLFPFVGPAVYSILRPPEFLEDTRERELETRAAELRLRQLEEQSCPSCEFPIERNYLRCPNCRSRIKDPCESCGRPVDPRWSICPYCENPMQQQRRSRRGSGRGGRGERGERGERSEARPRKAPRDDSKARAEARRSRTERADRQRPTPADRVKGGAPPKQRSGQRSERSPSPEEQREAERERIAASRRGR